MNFTFFLYELIMYNYGPSLMDGYYLISDTTLEILLFMPNFLLFGTKWLLGTKAMEKFDTEILYSPLNVSVSSRSKMSKKKILQNLVLWWLYFLNDSNFISKVEKWFSKKIMTSQFWKLQKDYLCVSAEIARMMSCLFKMQFIILST